MVSLAAASGAERAGPETVCAVAWEPQFVPIQSWAYYPRLAALEDGTPLAGYDHTAAGGQKAIGVARSVTGGASCGARDGGRAGAGDRRPGNAFPLQLADGTVLMACCHHSPGVYRIEVYASADGGATWQLRGTPATGSTGLWEPLLLQLPGGTVQVYYASEEGIWPDQRIQMRASADGGATWAGR